MNKDTIKIKLTLLFISSLTVMAGAAVAPALPSMLVHFSDVNNAELWVRLVLTFPALFILSVAPVAGIIIDRWGRKKLLLLSMIIYGIGGSTGLYFDTIGAILAGRALLGIAVAGMMTTLTALVADYFEGDTRARFLGIQVAFMGLGGVVFLTSAGLLTEIQWRLPFLIYLASFAMIPFAYYVLPEPEQSRSNADEKNHISGNGGTNNNQKVNEEQSGNYIKKILFIYSVTLVSMIMFYMIPTQIPFYIESLPGSRASLNGIAIGMATLFSSLMALLYGRVRKRFGFLSIVGMSFGLMGAGYVWISIAESYTSILAGLAVSGLGLGLSMPNITMWLTSEVPASVRGRAIGGLTTAIFMGQFISPVISQPLSKVFGLALTFQYAGIMLLIFGLIFLSGYRRISLFVKPEIKMKKDDIVSAQKHQPIPETRECVERAT